MPRQKSSDSLGRGTVFQPLLGCQLRFYSCAGGASVPLWSMGTACRQTEEYKERRPRWRVFGRCRGIRASRPPAGMCGRALAPLYPSREKSAVGGQTATGARKRPAPVAVVKGHPEGKRRREPTRSKGPGICRKAGPGVNGREADFPPPSRSVLPAVPATQTVLPAACQDPLCP